MDTSTKTRIAQAKHRDEQERAAERLERIESIKSDIDQEHREERITYLERHLAIAMADID